MAYGTVMGCITMFLLTTDSMYDGGPMKLYRAGKLLLLSDIKAVIKSQHRALLISLW